jgi:hypothetical protein
MEEKDLSEIIEIRAPNLVAEEVYRRLEENLKKRRPLSRIPYLPSYDDLLTLKEPEVSDAIGYHLWQAIKSDMAVGRQLVPSRIPLLGRFIDYLKMQFHDLVLYYINMLSARQATAYANLALALQLLARELARLRDQVEEQRKKDDQGD